MRGPAARAIGFATLPTRRTKRKLFRTIPAFDYIDSDRPTFLYTSGRPGRCNPAGVDCLYFSETARTSENEYDRIWRNTGAEHQPRLRFTAKVDLRRIVDLGNPETLLILGLTQEELFGTWRLAREPTRLQLLGDAVVCQGGIGAIRFPSAAGRDWRAPGWNLAIFPASLEPPDRVEILGRGDTPIEVIP